MNPPPSIPTPSGEPPTSYPSYNSSNGLGCISDNEEGGIGINEYGMIFFKNLQTVVEQIVLNAEGITRNTDPTVPWGTVTTALENIVAVVPPPDSTTLEVNNKIIVSNIVDNNEFITLDATSHNPLINIRGYGETTLKSNSLRMGDDTDFNEVEYNKMHINSTYGDILIDPTKIQIASVSTLASASLTTTALEFSEEATIYANGGLTVAPLTTFNQSVSCLVPPVDGNSLVNLAYLQTFPPANAADFFLNNTEIPSPPIDGYEALSLTPITNTPSSTTTTILHGSVYQEVGGFANDLITLRAGEFIPSGFWDLNLFCNLTTNDGIGHINMFWRLYGRTALGVEVLLGGDSSVVSINQLTPAKQQTASSQLFVETDLTPYSSLVLKIYMNNTKTGSTNYDVNIFYNGLTTNSHLHTSYNVYVPPSILTTANTWTAFNTFDNGIESNGTTSITGALYDSVSVAGTAGQILSSTGSAIAWITPVVASTPNIAQVLTVGNVSTNQSITGLDSITATTLNATDCTIDNLLDATGITTGAINMKNSQFWSSGGVILANTNVICPNFTGLASKASNLSGGIAGQLLYQSSVDTTAKLANGVAGKYLKTNGTTLAPSWDTPPLYFPPITMSNSSAVMGGSSYPQIPTTTQSNTGYDGWCFTNTTAGSAISWAMGGRSPTSVLGDYKGWYFCFMINVATATPFLNVYTLPATSPNFFNSRRTFITSGTGATPLVVGTPYIAYWQQDTSYPIPTRYGHTPFPLEMASGYPTAQIGAFANTETYYFMTIGSNSGSVVNTQSFIVSEVANVFANGIEPYQFLGSSVATQTAINIVGGLGGAIPYQSAVNTTALLANGASTYVLQSNGTTLAPSWVETVAKSASAQLALVSQRLAFGNAGSIPYQTAPNQTSFIVNGTAGYVLTANGGTLAPTWNASSAGTTPTIAQVLTAGSVATAGQTITGLTSITATNFTGLASTATNLSGGLGGAIPYQSAVNTTALLANGSVGQVLTSAGTTLPPIWQNASASSNATNLLGGAIGQIPYQSAVNTTLFTLAGTQNQVLIANNTGVPSWTDAVLLPAYGLCSFRTNNYTQTVQIGSGQTSYINNAVLTTQYISAFGVTFPATNGQFTVVNGGAYTVNIRVNLQSAGAVLSTAQLFLYSVTGSAIVLGTIQNYQYSTASATSNIVMEVNTIVPLVTATTYQVGFIQNYTGTISGVTINFCYISINRIF